MSLLLRLSGFRSSALRNCCSQSFSLLPNNRLTCEPLLSAQRSSRAAGHDSPFGVAPAACDITASEAYSQTRNDFFRTEAENQRKFLTAGWNVNSAAALPERLVLDRTRVLWGHLLLPNRPVRPEELYPEFERLSPVCRQLLDAGPPGRAALHAIQQVMRELLVTRESLAAARHLRRKIQWHFHGRIEYRSAEEARQDLLTVSNGNILVGVSLDAFIAAVNVWFPAYQRALQYIAEHGSGLYYYSPSDFFAPENLVSGRRSAYAAREPGGGSDGDGDTASAPPRPLAAFDSAANDANTSDAADAADQHAASLSSDSMQPAGAVSGGGVDGTARQSAPSATVTDDDIREVLLIAEDAPWEWEALEKAEELARFND